MGRLKVIGVWFCLALYLGGLAFAEQNAGKQAPTDRVKVVEEFMSLMVERHLVSSALKSKLAEIDRRMLAMLAPYYFESIGVDQSIVTINKYSPDGFRVVLQSGDYVAVKLLRKTNFWPTFIIFKTAEHQGRAVIEPSSINLAGKNDPSLVTPWFYAAEQNDLTAETLPVPAVGRGARGAVLPASAEVTRRDGVGLVVKLISYLETRNKIGEDARRTIFRNEILPGLAKGYTDIYGIDLNYYEEIAMDRIANYQLGEIYDCYVVLDCVGCLYDRYYFKIVMEEGRAKIMPTGIDNVRKTLSPVWLRE